MAPLSHTSHIKVKDSSATLARLITAINGWCIFSSNQILFGLCADDIYIVLRALGCPTHCKLVSLSRTTPSELIILLLFIFKQCEELQPDRLAQQTKTTAHFLITRAREGGQGIEISEENCKESKPTRSSAVLGTYRL